MAKEIRAAVKIICAGEVSFLRYEYNREGGPLIWNGGVSIEEDRVSFSVAYTAGTDEIKSHADFRDEFFDNKILWNKILNAKRRERIKRNEKSRGIKKPKKYRLASYKEKTLLTANLGVGYGLYFIMRGVYFPLGVRDDDYFLRKCNKTVKGPVIKEDTLRRLLKRADDLIIALDVAKE